MTALAACGGSDSEGADGEITVWATPTASSMQVWVAQEQGFFEDEGLDVTFETGADQATALQSLGTQTDINFTTTPVLFNALNRNFPVKVVSGMVTHSEERPGCGTVVSKEPIESALELQGKKVGVTSLTSIIPMSAQYIIEKEGGDPNKMQLVQVNFPMIDQLEAGNVDAILATAPYWNIAEENPDLIVGPDMCLDAVKLATGGAATSSPTGVFVANAEWAEKNEETIEKWRRALASASEWIDAHDAETRALLAEKTQTEQDIADITAFPEWTVDLDPATFEGPLDIARTLGLLEDRPDLTTDDFLFLN